ncbi:MAG: hypothetical protein K5771_03680 [Oscillospiraceae bacterium]|nr:hypothetical protein [Oscillospiraceae bacterium]
MKKIFVIILALVMLCSSAACGQKKAEPMAGGWALNESTEMSADAQKAFDKAIDGLMGVNYSPAAMLATQLVSGTNYCVLCEATVVYPDAQPYWALVYVYADLQGNAKVTNIVALDPGAILESGKVENSQAQGGMLGSWKFDRDGSVAADGAVMHLASQLVSGTNHCVLCKGWTLVFVYENLEGKTEILKTVPLDIAALSQPAAE